MTLVVDAALVVAALVDGGPDGRWAESELLSDDLAAPHLLPVEVANVLRRATLAGELSDDVATMAHRDLHALRIGLFPYDALAPRVWELRGRVTAYDGCYLALAEALGAPLATLDRKLSRVTGARCPVRTPPRRR